MAFPDGSVVFVEWIPEGEAAERAFFERAVACDAQVLPIVDKKRSTAG